MNNTRRDTRPLSMKRAVGHKFCIGEVFQAATAGILLLLCLSAAHGREYTGVVRVAGGQGIAGARIAAQCNNAVVFTDERGMFSLPDVTPGCILNVQAQDFTSVRQTVANPDRPVEILLNLDPLRQTVTVMASSPLLNSNPEIATPIDTRTLSELPSSIRDINRFALLDPRVRNTGSLGTDGIYGTRLTVNGQLFRFTHYRVDGLSNYEPVLGNGPEQVLSIASVAEYKVMVNQFSAEYGRTSAGIISAITRTGSDAWHGEAFYFLRPSGSQSAPPVSLFRVPNERHMWGAAAGGPLRHDFHIFTSLEGNQQTRGAYIQSPRPSFYPGHQNQLFGMMNIDKEWSTRQSLYVRLNAHSTVGDNANDAVGGFNQSSTARRDAGQNLGLQATHRWILHADSLNEIRLGVSNGVPLSYYALHPQTQVVRPSFSTEGFSDSADTHVRTWQASDVFTWNGASHELRLGGDFIRNKVRDAFNSQFGTYQMPPGPPRAGERPIQYTQTFGSAPVRYGDSLGSLFMQDDWRVQQDLTLNLGVRYDYQSVTHDANNLAPRFGFAWRPLGSHRTVIRGGAGLYYDQIFLQVVRGALQQGPASTQVTYSLPFGVPGFPAFADSLTVPPSGAGDRRDLAIFPNHRLSPYTGQFTLGVQQILGRDWTLSVNVSGNLSRKQLRVRELNAPSRFIRTEGGQPRSAVAADATRPYLTYEGVGVRAIGLFENTGSSRYAAFDIQVAKRFRTHFQLMAHYLKSFSMTDVFFTGGPNTGPPSDWGNPDTDERGPADFHQRHRLTAQGIVDLPLGWQLNGFLVTASGLPVNPLTGLDNNGDGNLADRPVGFGRNSFRAPLQSTMDASILKRFILSRRVQAELRIEGTNLLNKTNSLRVNSTYGDGEQPLASFLQPIAGLLNTDPGRQLQLGIRFTF